MRRKDRIVEDPAEQERIIDDCFYVTLAMVDEGVPYVVPVNFGYEARTIYIHGAREGKRASLLRKSGGKLPVSGVFVSHASLLVKGEQACNLSTRYASVMFEGVAEEVEGKQERLNAMMLILKRQNQEHRPLPMASLDAISIVRIAVHKLSAKMNNPDKA